MIKRGEKSLRLARAAATRRRQARLKTNRICVHTTGNHVYVQIISPQYKVLFSASTVEKEMREKIKMAVISRRHKLWGGDWPKKRKMPFLKNWLLTVAVASITDECGP